MIKNKKLLLSLSIVIALVIVVGFFVWKNTTSKQTSVMLNNSETPINIQNDSSVDSGISLIDTVSVSPDKVPDLSKEIVINGAFTPDIDAIYRQKLQDQIALLNKNSADFDGWILLGTLRKMVEDYDGAKEAWDFAGLLKPFNAVSFNNLGNLYGFYLKDLSKAEENYLRSIVNDPKNTQAYGDLADLYWYDKVGQKQEKIESLLKRGIEANADQNKNALVVKLAKYYDDIKDFGNAIKYYELFLKLDPNNIDVQERLNQIKSL